jgi:hypothetical protein
MDVEQLRMFDEPPSRWQFDDFRSIVHRARDERWSGRQSTSTLRSVRNGWWADQTARIGDEPTGSVVTRWLTKTLKAGRNPGMRVTEEIRPPAFAIPSFYAGAYMDIRAAYWSIYRRVTWDCEYSPGAYLALGRQYLAGFPFPANKLARNCVVGIAASQHYVEWAGGRARPIRRRGGLWNPNLTGFTWAVLGAVAWRMYDWGARYWNLDGAIVPWQRLEFAREWCAERGLEIRAKSRTGFCDIRSLGSYNCPGARTRGFSRARAHEHFSLPPRSVCDHAINVFAKLPY